MARGSLYYHFGDKNGLFKAVYKAELTNAADAIKPVIKACSDPYEALIKASQKFLDLCMKPTFRKITLIEAQSAMNFEERLELQSAILLSLIMPHITALLEKGLFSGHTPQTFTVFLYGILGEIGRVFDFSENITETRQTYEHAFLETMKKLKSA